MTWKPSKSIDDGRCAGSAAETVDDMAERVRDAEALLAQAQPDGRALG